MSSFIGHSLAGLMVYATARTNRPDQPPLRVLCLANVIWLVWLLGVASFPDIDYAIPALRPRIDDQTFRMTHSLAGALLLPAITLLVLRGWHKARVGSTRPLRMASVQLVLAGLSHLGLDLATGVSALPLLFPLNETLFKLPFGVLPSAGRIQLDNYFLYRNLVIELGVLVPIAISLMVVLKARWSQSTILAAVTLSLFVSSCFMVWAFTLTR